MPAAYNLSWDAHNRRWWKQHHGKRYVISCRQLKKLGYLPAEAPETKEGSYQAVNRWWADQVGKEPPFHHRSHIAVLERKREWAQRHGRPSDAERIGSEIEMINNLEATTTDITGSLSLDPSVRSILDALGKLGVDIPTEVARVLIDDTIWNERLNRDDKGLVAVGRRLDAWIDKYMEVFKVRQGAGEISPGEFQNAEASLHKFRGWMGAGASIDAIDPDTWERWWLHLVGMEASKPTKTRHLRFVRGFVRWLASRGLIAMPANLEERRYRFKGGPAAIPMPDIKEIGRILGEANGQLELHLHLMLNAGFSQVDVANLHPSEVDWTRGRITRKRSKTKDRENVPVVSYPLWPETFALLREHGQRDGDAVLLTSGGKRWVRDEIGDDGKRHKTDQIGTNYGYLKRRLKSSMRLGMWRKVGASILGDDAMYAQHVRRFLGHAPVTIAEKHYQSDQAGQAHFDEAVGYLREVIFLGLPKKR